MEQTDGVAVSESVVVEVEEEMPRGGGGGGLDLETLTHQGVTTPDSVPQSPSSSDTHEWYNSQGVRFTPQEEGGLGDIYENKLYERAITDRLGE